MAFKQYQLDDLNLTIYKRKNSRSLKINLSHSGEIKISIPRWTPYQAGLEFARSKEAWIRANLKDQNLLKDGQAIGKAHHLRIEPGKALKVSSRLTNQEVIVRHPEHLSADHPQTQSVARTAAIKALRGQAEQLLPQRLSFLAEKHGLNFKSVSVRQLKSRWGSCDQHKRITLNLFLIQMPWQLIDYVLLHELTHTQVFKHGPSFWEYMDKLLPNAKSLRKELKAYQPVLS